MSLRFKKTQPQDYQTDKLQSNIEELVGQIQSSIFFDGRLLTGVTINTSDTVINHLLGREPRGFIVVKLLNNSVIWQTSSSKRTLTLRASAQTTIDLWVF
jgi:hypothetical protein